MNPVVIEKKYFNRVVKHRERYEFEISENTLILIAITARCKSWSQNLLRRFGDDDLAIEIDDVPFYEFGGKRKEFNTPASWNGNELKNIKKTVYFILPLKNQSHTITFVTDGAPFVEDVTLYKIDKTSGSLTISGNLIPSSEKGKLFFDIATKNLNITAVHAEGTSVGRSKPKLTIDGNAMKDWSKASAKSGENNHFFAFTGINGAQPTEIRIEYKKDVSSNFRGRIALYKDIVIRDDIALRSVSNDDHDEDVIARLKDGDLLEILEERVEDDQVGSLSKIWHKVKYEGKEGYVLSSYVEIEGQERSRIVELVREKAVEVGVDPDLAIALAGCESKYKVYSVSDKDARGIFQLEGILIEDMNDPKKPFYSPVSDPFNFKENIAAGVTYLKWLYFEHYKNSTYRLERTIAGWNRGLAHVPAGGQFSFNSFPTTQPKILYTCTVENKKKRNWKQLFDPLMPALLLIISMYGVSAFIGWPFPPRVLTVWRFDVEMGQTALIAQNTIEELILYAETINTGIHDPEFDRGKEPPVLFAFDTRDETILLFRKNNNELVARLPIKRLGLKEEPDPNLAGPPVLDQAIEPVPGLFYFLAAPHGSCGSGGCVLSLYQYDLERDSLLVVDDWIFAGQSGFFLSPDNSKMVFARNAGSMCCHGGYVYLMDVSGQNMQEILLSNMEDRVTSVQSVRWRNDHLLDVEMFERVPDKDPLIKLFEYDINTGVKTLLYTKEASLG